MMDLHELDGVPKVLALAGESCSSRELRALRSCCKALHGALSPLVTHAYSPDDDLLVPTGVEAPAVLRLLANCANCTHLRLTPAQLSSCAGNLLRRVVSLTLVSDYTLSEQAFGRACVLLDLRCLLGLQGLQQLTIQQCLPRDGLDALLHLRLTHVDLSAMLEVNNKALSLLARMTSLSSLCLPAACCHAPRLNQLTAQGLSMCLPMFKRLSALHIKMIDLELLGSEAVRSWHMNPVGHPCVIKSLAAHVLPHLVSLTLEGLSESSALDSTGPLHVPLPPQGRHGLQDPVPIRSSLPGLAPSPTSGGMAAAGVGLSAHVSPRISSSSDHASTPLSPYALACTDALGEAPPHGPLYHALMQLANLTQLRYLCLGLHVLLESTPSMQARASLANDQLDLRPHASAGGGLQVPRALVKLCVDDALVTTLCSSLTQLTGLAFRNCWHIGAPGLECVARALPGLEVLDLEGSCRGVVPQQLSLLAPLARLRSLGLGRWGAAAYCPPYCFRLLLQQVQEAEKAESELLAAEASKSQAGADAQGAARASTPPLQGQPAGSALPGACMHAGGASECTLWHSACGSPGPLAAQAGAALQLTPRATAVECRAVMGGWACTSMRGHAPTFMLNPYLSARGGGLLEEEEEARSSGLSYQELNMDDFLASGNSWSTPRRASSDRRSQQEFLLPMSRSSHPASGSPLGSTGLTPPRERDRSSPAAPLALASRLSVEGRPGGTAYRSQPLPKLDAPSPAVMPATVPLCSSTGGDSAGSVCAAYQARKAQALLLGRCPSGRSGGIVVTGEDGSGAGGDVGGGDGGAPSLQWDHPESWLPSSLHTSPAGKGVQGPSCWTASGNTIDEDAPWPAHLGPARHAWGHGHQWHGFGAPATNRGTERDAPLVGSGVGPADAGAPLTPPCCGVQPGTSRDGSGDGTTARHVMLRTSTSVLVGVGDSSSEESGEEEGTGGQPGSCTPGTPPAVPGPGGACAGLAAQEQPRAQLSGVEECGELSEVEECNELSDAEERNEPAAQEQQSEQPLAGQQQQRDQEQAVAGPVGLVLGMLGAQHPHLTALDLSAWHPLRAADVKLLARSPAGLQLNRLGLTGCHGLRAKEVTAMAGLANLHKLDISYTHVLADMVAALPCVPALNEVVLTHAAMTWAASKAMQDISRRHFIRVSGYADANTSQANIQRAITRSQSGGALRTTRLSHEDPPASSSSNSSTPHPKPGMGTGAFTGPPSPRRNLKHSMSGLAATSLGPTFTHLMSTAGSIAARRPAPLLSPQPSKCELPPRTRVTFQANS